MPVRNIQSITDPVNFEERNKFNGGQLYSSDISKIGGAFQAYNRNMDFDGVDGLVTRNGLDGEISLAGSAMTLAHYWSASNPQILALGLGVAQTWDGSGISLSSGFSPATSEIAALRAGNKVYAVDGVSKMHYYDGSIWKANEAPDTNPAPTGCSLICDASSKIALTGKEDEPGRIFYSDIHLNDLPVFDQTNWSIDNGNDGLPNTAIASWFGNNHVVWKRNKTTVIYATPAATLASQYEVKDISNDIGCVAGKTAKQVKSRKMFFLADDGLRYVTPTDSDLGFDISEPLTDGIRDWWVRVNKSAIEKSHAIYRGSKYILWVPLDGSATCTHAFVWDTRLNSGEGGWLGVWDGWNSYDMVLANMDGRTKLYVSTNGGRLGKWLDYVEEDDVSDATMKDDGVDITSRTDSGGFVLEEPYNDKRWMGAEVLYLLDNATSNGVIYSAVDGMAYEAIGELVQSGGLTLPLSLPFDLPSFGNKRRPISLISENEGHCISLGLETAGGRLGVASVWVSGMVKGLRKDNSD